VPITTDIVPDGVDALKAALVTERQARQEAEARATGAEAMVAHLKLVIAKLRRERFGPSAERGAKLLDQLELQLEELEASATEDQLVATAKSAEEGTTVASFTRKKPARAPFPEHLPRERVVIPAPAACPCCGGKLAKLGEDITETLEVVPRQWKVVQTVREKFTCRHCEKITQPPAPFHTIARGRAGASLLAMILYAKYGHHQPLNRQSESFAREGIALDVSTMADWVGACTASLAPLVELIRLHVLGAARLHGDDTTVPVLATGKTMTGRVWTPACAGAGSMSATTGRLPDRTHPPRCSSIPATAMASTQSGISPTMPGSSRPMPMAGSMGSMTPSEVLGRSPRRRAGATGVANSLSWQMLPSRPRARNRARRWRLKQCARSTRSSQSSAR